MVRRASLLLVLVLLLAALCTMAQGAEEQEYIFRLRQDIMLFSERTPEMENVQTVYGPEGIFCTDDAALIAQLQDAGLLEYCVPNETIYLQEVWEDTQALQTLSWPRSLVGYSYGADRDITGKGVRVAVIDSGLSDPNGEFASAVIEQGVNFLAEEDSEDRQDTTDVYGHGTNVTRMIASTVIGLAPEATIIPLKCFDAQNGDVDNVVAAIYTAVDGYDCHIINLSLGMTLNNKAIAEAVDHALEQGVIVVAAAGNLYSYEAGKETNNYRYPAAQEGVIGVGFVSQTKELHRLSARNDSVLVVAPGTDIPAIRPDTGSQYLSSGTSYAAPAVSAVAALALSRDPELTGEEFAELLAKTAEDLGTPGYDVGFGHGLVNAGLLLAALGEDAGTLSFSCVEAQLYASCWVPAALTEPYTACVAMYRRNGRFAGASLLEGCSGDLFVSNIPLPAGAAYYKVLYLQEGTYTPLSAADKYTQ